MIPLFPYFRPLEFNDAEVFDKALQAAPPSISELTFTNLYAWRMAYKFSVSLLDDWLIVVSEAEGTKRYLLPIGLGDRQSTMEKIMKETGGIFFRLPEETKRSFEEDARFIIQEDRDNSDYLYEAADLITLCGRKYDGKRNLIKKFRADHSYEYIRLNQDNVRMCLDFEEAWCTVKNCDAVRGLSQERIAIREMVEKFSAFGLIGAAIKVSGAIRAVCLAQKLNQETLVMHVLKADAQIAGLYQNILQEFLGRQAQGFKFVNLEQDLGVEGLRKAKLSYQPCALVKKYTLKFRQES